MMSEKFDKKRGVPTKLTAEMHARFCDLAKKGLHYCTICDAVKITYATFRHWMNRGERDKSEEKQTIFADFFDDVNSASAIAHVFAVDCWNSKLNDDWKAARDFLRYRYPKLWSPKEENINTNINLDADADIEKARELLEKYKKEF